jgi:hypothetical protein
VRLSAGAGGITGRGGGRGAGESTGRGLRPAGVRGGTGDGRQLGVRRRRGRRRVVGPIG